MLTLSHSTTLTSPWSPWHVSWDDLRALLLAPQAPQPFKESLPLWSPAEREPGAPDKGGRYVRRLHLAVLDVDGPNHDGVPWDVLEQTLATVEAYGLEAVAHASYSAGAVWPDRTKFRLVIPLQTPVDVTAWRKAWRSVARLCPVPDGHCKDAGRFYYLPGHAPGADPGSAWAVHVQGGPLDLSRLPEAPARGVVETRRITRDDLRDVAKIWGAKKDRNRMRLTRALKALIAGDPYAEEGSRDQTSFELIFDLVREIPEADTDSLLELFRPSLALMGGVSEDNLRTKVENARVRLYEEPSDNTPDRSTGDPFVLATSTGSSWFARGAAGWLGPYTGDVVDVALRQGLQWARTQINLDRPDGAPKSRQELLWAYGRTIERHTLQLGIRASYLDGDRFVEAAATPRDHVANYSTLVDEWLAVVLGPAKRDVLTWLAIAPDLEEPLAALYLWGKKGVGKSLFAQALSRLWTEDGATPARVLFSDYNGALLRCPVVFADEHIPRPKWGSTADVTAVLREKIQARTHLIERKYLPDVEARGCIRLVIAANDQDTLTFDENMGPEDAAAVADRFYMIHVQDRAESWITPDKAAQIMAEFPGHVLHLAAQGRPAKTTRFWIRGSDHHAEALALRGGLRSEICRYLVAWLDGPKIVGRRQNVTHVWEGDLLVSTQDVLATWERYIRDVKPPRTGDLTRALKVIAPEQTRTALGRFWVVDKKRLQTWVDTSGWNANIQGLIERQGSAKTA